MEKKTKTFGIAIVCVIVVILGMAGLGAWLLWGNPTSNPHNYMTIGEIPVPSGYTRIAEESGFASYLRGLSLKEKGSDVLLFTGKKARLQSLNYAVVDMPLISNDEQCADVCMRLRAEYLYNSGKTGNIHFKNVGGKNMRYAGGHSRKTFERYLRKVYGVASTLSLSRELSHRNLKDIRPGDVFVYAGVDRGHKLGHAIMVVDVAHDEDGNIKVMLAEGNTPARDIHILRNWKAFGSPWFSLDTDASHLLFDSFYYKGNELRSWSSTDM